MDDTNSGGKCECGRALVLSTSHRNLGQPLICVCKHREYRRNYMRAQYADPNSKTNQYLRSYFQNNKVAIMARRAERQRLNAEEIAESASKRDKQLSARTTQHQRDGVRKQQERFRRDNRHKLKEYSRRHLYKLEPSEYDKMLADQGGNCLLCLKPMKRPHTDHSHTTGKVRGLLCGGCNMAVGFIEADPTWVSRVLQYLNS